MSRNIEMTADLWRQSFALKPQDGRNELQAVGNPVLDLLAHQICLLCRAVGALKRLSGG
jgi:hypothetical protein